MDMNTEHPDPFRDAIQEGVHRAVQLGSVAVTGAQIYAYRRRAHLRAAAEQDERGRRALQAQIRAERNAAHAQWAPALDPAWLQQATLIETAQAWGAGLPYSDSAMPWGESAAASAMRRCEERLRELHSFAMARYDRLRGDGLGPAEAMREAAPLFALHPQARDGSYTPRPMLEPAPDPDRPASPEAPAPSAGPAPAEGGRSTRPCDEDFPLSIHEVLDADARSAAAAPAEAPSSHAVRKSAGNTAQP
jgi:hypothetical protein